MALRTFLCHYNGFDTVLYCYIVPEDLRPKDAQVYGLRYYNGSSYLFDLLHLPPDIPMSATSILLDAILLRDNWNLP